MHSALSFIATLRVPPIGNSHALDRSPFLTCPSFLCCKQKDTSPSYTKGLKNLASNYSQVIESHRRNLLNLNLSLATLFLSRYPPRQSIPSLLCPSHPISFSFPPRWISVPFFPGDFAKSARGGARCDIYAFGLGHRLSARNAMSKQARRKTLHCIASSRKRVAVLRGVRREA